MSLYKVVVNCISVGMAGSHTLLVSGDFPHINEARIGINEWVANEYAGRLDVNVTFLNHSDQIYVTDLKSSDYDKVIIMR
ncbi:hypothetical protein pEaSNUABM50_00013 [Erwinia phage pEa_SNUABM_50]|uniref:Uncharacterized protein n=4 Tax=Eneladusvirus BF TaxID=2560751 RepID=A0A7L8ZML2_9CAUD|nr:hypothetical protein FDH34_gp014 [Serratia phage BF]QOI70952.1 hypothetical protein pEaSNUABM12_00014 [Erwinia phage pEa_SNUABM_12]QOI71497.1 hypothetical protein pEaSNUABM47_00013 [Erwinia phage pEa_SNUABM_47]QOI72037.1 hypothetical protein pEaSNUABM50_00013 [Erwinia phage pEa_SNUABM_50]QXO11160.1 hypothetical protein pEaSNUABM19_00014 [Erwinia phage pEa_SNUABM_19]QXO11709.1 hypothetical protein pEaSNUABM44_00013 [Erwinia phage pEa_SNUABM_44]